MAIIAIQLKTFENLVPCRCRLPLTSTKLTHGNIIQQCTCMSWLSVLCPRARVPRSASHSKVPPSALSAGVEKHYCFSRRKFVERIHAPGLAPLARLIQKGRHIFGYFV